MAPYNPMKKHMEKLDEWGASQAKKLNAQRDAGSGTSMSDRLNMARGRDNRWESSSKTAANAEEDPDNIVPARSAARVHVPPPPIAPRSNLAVPPPPPQRTGSGIGAPPAPPSRYTTGSAGRPPSLPRRMDNENGTTNPPPPYPAGAPSPPTRTPSQTSSAGLVEFSKFTAEDKEAFFSLLDQYFAARQNVNGKSSQRSMLHESRRSTDPVASPSTTALPSSPKVVSSISKTALKPSGPGAKASMATTSNLRASSSLPNPSQFIYPRLSASQRANDAVCKALECASFLVYRDSYPEWSGSSPWFTQKNAIPTSLQGRRDIAWSSSSMYRGSEHTMMGAALFDDLSCLWWRVSWDATSPAATARVDAAYKDTPQAWDDEGRLQEAARGFGDWIAGFAEQAEQNKVPIGDGECWTLAAEATKYTNNTAQLTPDNRLLTSIGRTHGHLIYAAKADPINGQCGRWRGGDRIRERWGGIRRGDIIEWRTARCSELNAPRGSYVTLGAPEHTAIIIANTPVPERLSSSSAKAADGADHYALLSVKPSSTQAEIRASYLSAARKHHPDRQRNGGQHDDTYMERLNEAYETLSDPARRSAYDDARQSGFVSKTVQSNVTRVSAQVDLDAMEVCEQQAGDDSLTFFHPCRCGSGFYVSEEQLGRSAKPVIQCSGCSERIRIISGQVSEEEEEENQEEEDDQPTLEPWELGSITTIEQSAGQVPIRRTYSLAKDSFTSGELWIYRPVWEKEYVGGAVQAGWPPSIPGWQAL